LCSLSYQGEYYEEALPDSRAEQAAGGQSGYRTGLKTDYLGVSFGLWSAIEMLSDIAGGLIP
jgi:hypothetical protein